MNKIERVEAVLRGERPQCTPAGFWYHYDVDLSPKEMVKEHIRTFNETGPDIYKIMQEYVQPIEAHIRTPEDWKNVRFPGRKSLIFKKLEDVLKEILDITGHDALTFHTMFGPLKTAVQTYGYDLVMAHCAEAPEMVADAIRRIAEAQTEWAAGFIEAGADGLFFSGQFSEPGRFTREEFDKLCSFADLIVLNAAEEAGARNILHICGEPDYDFASNPKWYVNYPFAIVNWSVKDTGISITEGKKIFNNRPILGGLNNRGAILDGSDDEIREDVNKLLDSLDTLEGFMVGADCTIQGENISRAKIGVAIEAAHNYK